VGARRPARRIPRWGAAAFERREKTIPRPRRAIVPVAVRSSRAPRGVNAPAGDFCRMRRYVGLDSLAFEKSRRPLAVREQRKRHFEQAAKRTVGKMRATAVVVSKQ